ELNHSGGEKRMTSSTAIRMTAALLLPLSLAGSTEPTVERFEIDRNHSRMGFAARHMGVATVRGHFTDFEGHVLLDTVDITRSTARVVIETASISTNNERRDNDRRSDEFFDAVQYARIVCGGRLVSRD